jgi:RimJ/RimL family protein N-acetyltransferase
VKLEDDEVLLRPFGDDDVPAIVAACQDPEIPRWTGVPSPYTEDDARRFLRETEETVFAITAKDTGELLGAIGVREVDQGNIQIGYWVKREARGRGVATRALKLVARYAVEELRSGRVQLFTEPGNVASQRVAEKAGFVREGVLRRYLNMKGVRRDGVIYSLLPEDPTP